MPGFSVPYRDNIPIEQWRFACEMNHHPIAFVDLDQRFVFCNTAYCQLVGWAESELKNRRWQDITKPSDIGGDIAEVESIFNGVKKHYYLEKVYLRKDLTEVAVQLYVYRFPDIGPQVGFICFADRKGSIELMSMEKKYSEIQQTLILIQTQQQQFSSIASQLSIVNEKIESNTEETRRSKELSEKTLLALAGKSDVQVAGGDLVGHNKTVNQSSIIIFLLIAAITISIGALIVVAGGTLRLQQGDSKVEVIQNPSPGK